MAEGHRSVYPLPDDEELATLYRDHYFQGHLSDTHSPTYTEEELAHKRLHSQLIFEALEGRVQGPVLEVGFGEGFTLAVGGERGWEMVGLDYTDEAQRQWNPRCKAEVMVGDPSRALVEMERRFGAVILQNVVEHVVDPGGLLAQVAERLLPGGIVVVAVPNDYSDLQRDLVERGVVDREYWFSPPQHLHYFNTDNIGPFLKKRGWDLVDAYSGFPIEFFLLHSGSNYVRDRSLGKEAHRARVTLELMMAQRGLLHYLDYCRSLHRCGMGRIQTLLIQQQR